MYPAFVVIPFHQQKANFLTYASYLLTMAGENLSLSGNALITRLKELFDNTDFSALKNN